MSCQNVLMRTLLIALALSATVAAQSPRPIPAPADVAAPPADATKTASGLASKVIKPGKQFSVCEASIYNAEGQLLASGRSVYAMPAPKAA